MEVIKYDYMTEEGKKVYEDSSLTTLPALLFSTNVQNSESYNELQAYLVPAGDYVSLKIGAVFDPTKEICDNGVDDIGNGLIDCEDPSCANTLICNADALGDCAVEQGLTAETAVFYYSDSCPWCAIMKPAVEQLKNEGYLIESVEAGNAQQEELISACFRQYMSEGVPQFICPKTAEIRPGAFADQSGNVNMVAFKAWLDACKA
jgi:hypothetical protein